MMIESGTSQCPRLYNVILAGPQHREIRKNSTSNASWGPQHREIGTPISTGNASWGQRN